MALLCYALTFFPFFVQQYFTQGWFYYFAISLRGITGHFPFTIGEWAFVILIIVLIFKLLYYLLNNKIKVREGLFWKNLSIDLGIFVSKLYIAFMLIWGLNYSQPNPAILFGLTIPKQYTLSEMDQLSQDFIQEMNNTRELISDSSLDAFQLETIFDRSYLAFNQLTDSFPFLGYRIPSIKISSIPTWGDYLGYLAFYQPLTGEAVVRGDLPILTQPFTVCHEIAHQLGFASETEANFIAYWVASQSQDPLFRYSMQLQMFTYAQTAHLNMLTANGDFKQWKLIVERNKKRLSSKVLQDRKKIRAFFMERSELLIPASETLYDQFLQWNHQAKGVESYNDVLLWALADRKKHL